MSSDLGHPDAHDMPSDAELDATDRFLSSIATGADPAHDTEHDPVTELLRAASAPAGAGELVGADRFVAAISPEETRAHRAAASPAVLVGRAVAAKAAVIAAVTVLGIAGAGAATGVILHVANEPRPQPVVTVDDPDATSPDTNGDAALGDTTPDARTHGVDVDPVRTRTCAAATDGPGLEQLARAATAARASSAADYCRGTGTFVDPDRPDAEARADSSSAADDVAAGRGRGTDPGAPSATPSTPAGNGGANNGHNGENGGSGNNGVATPGSPNTNANPKAGTGATNGGGNSSGAPNSATPGSPNANANPKADDGATNGATNSSNSTDGPTAGARSVGNATAGPQGDGTRPAASTGANGAGRSPTVPDAATPGGSAGHPERRR